MIRRRRGAGNRDHGKKEHSNQTRRKKEIPDRGDLRDSFSVGVLFALFRSLDLLNARLEIRQKIRRRDQQALQRAREYAAEQDAKLAARPDDKAMQNSAKSAHEAASKEEQENSRLFAIDAGLDLQQLRAQYPDRNRYAIVRAQVRPLSVGGQNKIAGYIDSLSIAEINVPHEFHAAFDKRVRPVIGRMQTTGQGKFEASVAFGQRLEPWLVGITAGMK